MQSTSGSPSGSDSPSHDPSLFICLKFFPSEHLVSAISRLVCDFCEMALQDLDAGSRFQMAAHELAENITKYATSSRVSLEVELLENGGKHVLRIRTRNQSSPEKLVEVGKRLAELKQVNDPLELYDRLILETAPLKGTSGLGLARIRAEGGLDFDYSIKGTELTVEVQAPVVKSDTPLQHVLQLGIHRVVDENVEFSPSLMADGILVRLKGEGNSFATEPLRDYLASVREELVRLSVPKITFDVCEMTFLNSSGLKQFVAFLHAIKTGALQVKVDFLFDSGSAWQRRTLSALGRMCPEFVTLREKSASSAA